jgi:hypothetical protein
LLPGISVLPSTLGFSIARQQEMTAGYHGRCQWLRKMQEMLVEFLSIPNCWA